MAGKNLKIFFNKDKNCAINPTLGLNLYFLDWRNGNNKVFSIRHLNAHPYTMKQQSPIFYPCQYFISSFSFESPFKHELVASNK